MLPLFVFAIPRNWKGPDAIVMNAIIEVESGGDFLAYNKKENARGWLQIREICLKDVNRIYKTDYTEADCWSKERSLIIAYSYLFYYGYQYYCETGKLPSREVYARIWNGGPTGWKKESTKKYWKKICAAMPVMEFRIYYRE